LAHDGVEASALRGDNPLLAIGEIAGFLELIELIERLGLLGLKPHGDFAQSQHAAHWVSWDVL
jgi:hypothetical protein